MVSFIRFIFSKGFVRQLALMGAVILVLVVIATQWLKHYTRHNEFIVVPDVVGMSLDEAQSVIESKNLIFFGSRLNPL